MATNSVLIDDRLLVAVLTGEPVLPRGSRARLFTTGYWYFRACRAAVLGAAGQLSGPFGRLGSEHQADAIRAMLRLPPEIGLPDPRSLIPAMVDVAGRQGRLNLMNLEATAAAHQIGATVLLSPPAAAGVLPLALEAEGITWRIHDPA